MFTFSGLFWPGSFSPVFDYGFQKRCKGVHCVDLGESFPCYVPSFIFSFFNLWRTFSSMFPFAQSLFQIDLNSNEYLLAKFGFDTAENGPCKVCPISAYRSPRSSSAKMPEGLEASLGTEPEGPEEADPEYQLDFRGLQELEMMNVSIFNGSGCSLRNIQKVQMTDVFTERYT